MMQVQRILKATLGATLCCGALLGVAVSREAQSADSAPDLRARPLEERLAAKIGVHYWREYLSEVADDLEVRAGVSCRFPAFLDRRFIFELSEKEIPVRAVLEKLAAAGGLDLELKDGQIYLWRRASDEVLANLGKKLQGPDLWDRREAIYDLCNLGDPRAYDLIFQALENPDPGLVYWTSEGLQAHLTILPYLNNPAQDRLTAPLTAQFQPFLTAASSPDTAYQVWQLYPAARLLGALNTPASRDFLLKLLAHPNIDLSNQALDGLGYCPNAQARDAVIKLAEGECSDRLKGNLVAPLGRTRDARAVEILLRWLAQSPAASKAPPGGWSGRGGRMGMVGGGGSNLGATIYNALSGMHLPESNQAVLALLSDRGRLKDVSAGGGLRLDVRDPSLADAQVGLLGREQGPALDQALESLARVRDARVLNALVASLENRKSNLWDAASLLAGLRDPQAEVALKKLAAQPEAEPDAAPMTFGAPPMTFGAFRRQYDWSAALLQTRNPRALDPLWERMKKESENFSSRSDAGFQISMNLCDPQRIAELAGYLLDKAGQPLLQQFLVQHLMRTQTFGLPGNTTEHLRALFDARLESYARMLVLGMQSPVEVPIEGKSGSVMRSGNIEVEVVDQFKFVYRLAKGNPYLLTLGRIRSPRAQRNLFLALTAENPAVREAAFQGIPPAWFASGAEWSEALLNRLKDAHSEVRQAALDSAAQSSASPALKEALAALLADENLKIRETAALTLARWGDARGADILHGIVTNPARAAGGDMDWMNKDRVWRAAGLLLRLDDPRAVDLIMELAGNRSMHFSDACIRDLTRVESPKLPDLLKAMMTNSNLPSDVRADAAMGLKDFQKNEEAMGVLIEILRRDLPNAGGDQYGHATAWNSRSAILRSLTGLKDPGINDKLLALVRDDKVSTEVRNAIAGMLCNSLRDPASRAQALPLARDKEISADVRASIAAGLLGFTGYGVPQIEKLDEDLLPLVEDLIGFYQDPSISEDVHRGVAAALAGSKDPRARQTLVDALANPKPAERLLAAADLAHGWSDERAVEPLLGFLETGSQRNQGDAVYALQTIANSDSIKAETKATIKAAIEKYNQAHGGGPRKAPVPPPKAPDDF